MTTVRSRWSRWRVSQNVEFGGNAFWSTTKTPAFPGRRQLGPNRRHRQGSSTQRSALCPRTGSPVIDGGVDSAQARHRSRRARHLRQKRPFRARLRYRRVRILRGDAACAPKPAISLKHSVTLETAKRTLDDSRRRTAQTIRELGTAHWKRWGPYLAERAWGTVREDYSANGDAWNYLSARSCPLARLSLERGRHRRHLRPPPVHLLRARALERRRPHSQGAPLRPHRARGQSRRRRQGAILLSRQHADAFLHEVPLQVPAAGLSLR